MRSVNLATITDTQSLFKILPLSGFNLIRAKQKLLRKHKGAYESFSSRLKSRKSQTLTTLLEFGKTWTTYIVLPRAIDPRRMGLLRVVRRIQEGTYSSSSSSTSSSSPTVSEIQAREREDRIESDISPVQVSTSVDDRSGQPDGTQANKIQKPNKKETTIELGDPLYSEIPERLQEFRENLVDDEFPVQGDSHASSSHEVSLEPIFKRREDLGKHSVYTHFPKDRNCEICQRTKITRAPCRRRIGGAVPRAEKFGDLITADHKVLSEGCESRNNHRCAIVVQDLATKWIQAYPCKTKTSQETQRSLQKFLEPERKPKVIYTDNSLEFGKACEDLSWNHCTSTPHRSETNGIAERAVRRVKEGRHLSCIVAIRLG